MITRMAKKITTRRKNADRTFTRFKGIIQPSKRCIFRKMPIALPTRVGAELA